MTEEWIQIEGYENYEVSNLGRVRNKKFNKLRKFSFRGDYLHVVLSKDSMTFGHTVHRLVGIAFIPNPDNKPQINHIDGNKTNNTASNLEWVSSSENNTHAFKAGLRGSGEDNPKSKLTNQQVIDIRNKYEPITYSYNRLAKEYNMSKRGIIFIIQQKTYKEVA